MNSDATPTKQDNIITIKMMCIVDADESLFKMSSKASLIITLKLPF